VISVVTMHGVVESFQDKIEFSGNSWHDKHKENQNSNMITMPGIANLREDYHKDINLKENS
jgi:hypothetical protein